jgi:hypothetical protein
MTINQLATHFLNSGLQEHVNLIVQSQPLQLIGIGLIYRMLSKNFHKHYDLKPEILKAPIEVRNSLFRVRSFTFGVMFSIVFPTVAFLMKQTSAVTISEAVKVKIETKTSDTTSGLLPFISLLSLREIVEKNNKRFKGRGFNFIKWIIYLILLFCTYKYNILTYISLILSYVPVSVLVYIAILGICASLVLNSLAYFILCIENEIKIDLSKIKIKWFRDILTGLLAWKTPGMDLEYLKKCYAAYIYFTLLILFTIPIIYIIL